MGDGAVANREQIEDWDGEQGEHWVAEADRYDTMSAPFGEALLDAAGLRAGDRVLDVGCGNGWVTLEAARRVQPGGSVVGADVSRPMLGLARERAAAAGVGSVELLEADAQVHAFGERFDALVSRFGLLFFEDPGAAFSNLAGALRPGGRIAFTAWQGLMQSEWILVPGAAASVHVGMPEGIEPGAPGPFGLADPDRTRELLERAGFEGVAIEDVTRPMRIGDDVDDAIGFIRSMPLVRGLLEGAPAEQAAAAIDAAREALVPYAGPDGVVMHDNGAWLVTARR